MPIQNRNEKEVIPAWSRVLLSVLLAGVVSIVYWQTVHHGFINYDDPAYVTSNVHVKDGVTLRNIAWAFSTFTASNWHPLTWLSHMLDVQFFGLNPFGHHLTSIILHLANTLLILFLLWRTTGNWWRSLVVAALFGLHPLHVESVAWIAERKDVLSTFFMLVTMIFYHRYTDLRRPLPYLVALTAFAMGLLSKPMLVTLPFVLLLCDYWPLGRLRFSGLPGNHSNRGLTTVPWMRLIVEKIPFLALTLISCIVTYYAQQQAGAVAASGTMPMSFRVINAMLSYVGYMEKLVWPHNLAIIYPLRVTLTLKQGILAGVALLLVSLMVWRLGRRHAWLVTGWLWYLGTLVPVIGLVQVGQQAMADRYTYIPMIGLFIMCAWGIPTLVEGLRVPRNVLPLATGLVLTILTVLTWAQLELWKNGITLFAHAARVVPDNHIAYRILGNALAREGRFSDADASFREALRIRPNDGQTQNEWGASLAYQQRIPEAIQHFTDALRADPGLATAHYNLGVILAEQGRFAEAIGHYLAALKIQPELEDVHNNLGAAYASLGDYNAALRYYDAALRFDPGNAEILYNQGMALAMQGRLDDGIASFRQALAIRPTFPEAHYNLGVALAKTANFDDAIPHFTEALRLKPGFSEAQQALEKALKRKK